ncbi:MAG: hypothetical protein RLZ98_2327 [Pseudomonadota bacterium]
MQKPSSPKSHRTLFISDLHLGSARFQAHRLRDFLSHNPADTVFLVGDIFDFWSLRAGAVWAPAHTAILQSFCRMVDSGQRIVLIPGNHDEHISLFVGHHVDGIEIAREIIHETATGERLLVHHGHRLDETAGWSAAWAHHACAWRERADRIVAPAGRRAAKRRRDGNSGPWQWIRRSVGGVARLERALIDEARARGLDGVICGHTHIPADREIAGLHYLNCGDWVTNCTAITEDWSGRLELRHWPEAAPRSHARDAEPCLGYALGRDTYRELR